MPFITEIPLDKIKVFSNPSEAALGDLLQIAPDHSSNGEWLSPSSASDAHDSDTAALAVSIHSLGDSRATLNL